MLYAVDSEEKIEYIPHPHEFELWRSRLSDAEYDAIVNEINSRIGGDEVKTAGWIPGTDWSGANKVFEPIYSKACLGDFENAAKCFGLIMWVVMMEHTDSWAFGRYEKDGIPIRSLTYFKVHL